MGTGGLLLRRIRARVSDEPTGFVWVEEHKLAASGFPASRGQVEWLVGRGIAAILTLTPDALPEQVVTGLRLNLMHLPMQDHSIPELGTLERGVAFIRDQLAKGNPVLVHCLAGEGRTGCLLAAYLIAEEEMTTGEVLTRLRAIKPAFVEPTQEKSLKKYELSLGRPAK